MVDEVISYICPKNGHSYLDATFGQGGYTSGIFSKRPQGSGDSS